VGAGVFLIWIAAAHFILPAAAMPEKLAGLPPGLRAFWIASRIAGSVALVPIAEELAYRGYLMRRLCKSDFESLPFGSVHWTALGVSAVLFGLAHGPMWAPGIAAGVAYGLLVVRRGGIGDAVAAHMLSNALIAGSVVLGSQWQLW
jgi:CAAX prenyl protease-like protein